MSIYCANELVRFHCVAKSGYAVVLEFLADCSGYDDCKNPNLDIFVGGFQMKFVADMLYAF
jgi:hypothetical protein